MNQPATSLDRLHDIVLPPPVGLWPPAAAWYGVIGAVVLGLLWWGYHQWSRWRANAYRRAALRQLATAGRPAEIAEILRRVALAVAPREVIASQVGEQWPRWLTERCGEPMPAKVREQLTMGIYREANSPSDVESLRTYAARWISRHHNKNDSQREARTETPG